MTELHGKIYLTKADMPKGCDQCPFCNGADECMVQNEDSNFLADTWDDLRSGCPLEEIEPVTVQDVTDNNVRSKEWGDGFKQGYEDGYKVGFDADKWISVKDRLPENMDDRVLVLLPTKSYDYPIGNQHIDTDRYRGEYRKWVRYGDKVTHWMPLPKMPQPPEGE